MIPLAGRSGIWGGPRAAPVPGGGKRAGVCGDCMTMEDAGKSGRRRALFNMATEDAGERGRRRAHLGSEPWHEQLALARTNRGRIHSLPTFRKGIHLFTRGPPHNQMPPPHNPNASHEASPPAAPTIGLHFKMRFGRVEYPNCCPAYLF